ncbi:MAG: hypothetical protein KC964_14275, partial [Candidatus Omnitrophica bacterium]|nr:hypothetical protein [Candidatus Omnitrophota bacterium]
MNLNSFQRTLLVKLQPRNEQKWTQSVWRYVTDGNNVLRVDEIYDDDNDGSLHDDYSAGNWRMMEEKFYQQGVISNLVYKRVTTYVDDISDTVDDTILYYYGYDQVGNVVYISEDTGASTTKRFVFH